MKIKRVCILAVGTELSTGQIVNSNAAWLSEKLTEWGAETCWHLTVADDRLCILKALQKAVLDADLILVTGGLGPTRDDFTREVIATWIGQELAFDPLSWEQLEQRAAWLKFQLSPSQRQQCYFPQGSQVFTNPAGTANAFLCQYQQTLIVALPGPPNEIQAIWEAHLENHLSAYLPGKAPQTLYRWQCMGLPEADLGEKVEAILQGSGFQTGYRIHFPYIEVKVWIPHTENGAPWLQALETALAPWTVLKDDQDLAELLLLSLPDNQPVIFCDAASQGQLAQRLQPVLSQCHRPVSVLSHYNSDTAVWPSPASAILLSLEPLAAGAWRITLKTPKKQEITELSPPYPLEMRNRNQRYLIERALQIWWAWL